MEAEPDDSDLDESLTPCRQSLRIAGQAAGADQPTERALDVPTLTLDRKAAFGENLQNGFAIHEHPLLTRLIAWLRKNFGVPAQSLFDPVDEWTGGAMIGKPMDQTWKTSNQILQEQSRPISIAESGSVDQDGQDQALRLNQQVSLATEAFFPPSKPRSIPRTGLVWIDWLSMRAALGSSSRPIWVRTRLRKAVMAFSPVPSRVQRRKEWYTVFALGTSWGIGLHEQPVRNTSITPVTISRLSMGSRGEYDDGSGRSGARRSHCASVTSDGYGFRASGAAGCDAGVVWVESASVWVCPPSEQTWLGSAFSFRRHLFHAFASPSGSVRNLVAHPVGVR